MHGGKLFYILFQLLYDLPFTHFQSLRTRFSNTEAKAAAQEDSDRPIDTYEKMDDVMSDAGRRRKLQDELMKCDYSARCIINEIFDNMLGVEAAFHVFGPT